MEIKDIKTEIQCATSKHFFDTDSDMTDALETLKEISMEKPNTVCV